MVACVASQHTKCSQTQLFHLVVCALIRYCKYAIVFVVWSQFLADNFLPPMLEALLPDYQRNIPAARNPEVRSTNRVFVRVFKSMRGKDWCNRKRGAQATRVRQGDLAVVMEQASPLSGFLRTDSRNVQTTLTVAALTYPMVAMDWTVILSFSCCRCCLS